jgi:uncharacterized protein
MAEFLNPFVGVTPGRKLTERETTRAVRMALAAEEEAVHFYEALADATENKLAKAVLQDIANEERVHAGEFLRVLELMLGDEAAQRVAGAGEVDEMNQQLEKSGSPSDADSTATPSVGSLKKDGGNE